MRKYRVFYRTTNDHKSKIYSGWVHACNKDEAIKRLVSIIYVLSGTQIFPTGYVSLVGKPRQAF